MRGKSWLYEIPIFYALLLAAQRVFFPDNFSFHDANPSPFWLGIAIFALRYGTMAGLLSGLASAGLYIAGFAWSAEHFRMEDFDFYMAPGLFVLAGTALGVAADRSLERIQGLGRSFAELAARNRGLEAHVQSQKKVLRSVQQQVVSQMSSIVTLYHGSRDLGSLERGALLTGIVDFFTQALQAEKAALYVAQDGGWSLREERGWSKEDSYPRMLGATEGLVGMAGAQRRVTSLRQWLSDDAEASGSSRQADAVMAAPLQDPEGKVVAVYAVQAMPFLRFSSASVNLLSLLSEWGSEALAKCLHVEELRARSIFDQELGVFNEAYFRDRLRQEFGRSKRYALPLSVLLARAEGLAALPVERREAFLRALGRVLRDGARDIDIVSRASAAGSSFGVIMMTATRAQAMELRQALAAAYAKLELSLPLSIGVGSYRAAMTKPEEIVEEAQKSMA